MFHKFPSLSFLRRTWMLWLFMFASNWLTLTQHHFAILGTWERDDMRGWELHPHTPSEAFGGILYFFPVATLTLLIVRFVMYLLYPQTIDADARTHRDVRDWNECTPELRVIVRTAVFIGLLIALCILFSNLARAVEPVDQVARWSEAQVNPKNSIALDVAASLYQRNKSRYEVIQKMRTNGVPAPILFCLHYRESDNNFRCHAHEGSTLLHRTRDEPKGRPLTPEPPYTFEQSAEDAYYVCERPPLDRIDWSNMQAALDKMESFNGFGYRRLGVPAPYLWSGTTLYKGGKYIKDHVFSRTAFDQQMGCAAILKRMMQRGVAVSFVKSSGRTMAQDDPSFIGPPYRGEPKVVVFRSPETPVVIVPTAGT